MKLKKILSSVIVLSVLLSVPQLSLAQAANNGSGGVSNNGSGSVTNEGGIENPLQGNADLATFLTNLLRIIFLLGTMVAVFFIIYAGFKYVIAQGDPGKLKEAHAMLLWSAIGAAILLGAQVIADVIKNTVIQLGA